MLLILLWYLTATLLGLAVFPLTYRLLPGLPDRGYSLSRSLGLLLWGYVYWLLGSLGFLPNTAGGLLLAFALVLGLSLWAYLQIGWDQLRGWIAGIRGHILAAEVLFFVAFLGWAFIRGTNPEAVGTEKPMELAFINTILGSPTLPPHDPWLSGYSISYYYFGYVLVAMLAKLTGTPGGSAFNLGIALIFGLTALGAYGLVYNLQRAGAGEKIQQGKVILAGMLGPLFVLIVSNLEGFLHTLHTRGLFWAKDASGQWVSPFWSWLGIQDLNLPPAEPFHWVPTQFWWWWRASRVLQDFTLNGTAREIIDEFPFFSFLLSDLHPHVLSMPFVVLAVGLGLNLYLGGAQGHWEGLHRRVNLRTLTWVGSLSLLGGFGLLWIGSQELSLRGIGVGAAGMVLGWLILMRIAPDISRYGAALFLRSHLESREIGLPLYLHPLAFLLAAVVLGGLAFLNTWDFPVYVALFVGAYLLRRVQQQGWTWGVIQEAILLGLSLGVSGVLLYLPFYIGFSSQAGGIIPNLVYPTRGAHLWVMFGTLLLPLFAYLAYQIWGERQHRPPLTRGFGLALGIFLGLGLLSFLLAMAIIAVPEAGTAFLGSISATSRAEALQGAFQRRLSSPGGWVTLLLLLGAVVSLLLRATQKNKPAALEFEASHSFTLLLMLIAGLLVLGPEFFFLRDQFGWRMNTIFKFYFQAWILWALAAAFVSGWLMLRLRGIGDLFFRLGLIAVLLMGLVYPVFSLWNKTNGLNTSAWTLDSTAYLENENPDEAAALRWLEAAPLGTIAEAVDYAGGSYKSYARAATISGKPSVLGWMGHESQWRGGGESMGSRQSDMETLFCSRDWDETEAILRRYEVRYVLIGSLERSTYQPGSGNCRAGLNEVKFETFMKPVFEQGDVRIYETTLLATSEREP